MGDAELFSKVLNLVLLPKISGTYAEGDPFLAKLQEIDRDISKFDHDPCEIPGDLRALASPLNGLGSARDKGEVVVDYTMSVGPQVFEPTLPSSEVNRPITRPPLQDLANKNGLPTKLKPKRTSKLLKSPVSSQLSLSTSAKKRAFPGRHLRYPCSEKKRSELGCTFPL